MGPYSWQYANAVKCDLRRAPPSTTKRQGEPSVKTFLVGLGLLLVAVSVVPQALAQKKMYRCGTNYQDRPCDGAVPVGKAAPAPAAAAAPAPAPAEKKSDFQRQVRCENYGRQMDELRERQKSMKQADMLDGQIKALEGRMKGDSC